MRKWIFVMSFFISTTISAQISMEQVVIDFYSALNEGDSLKVRSFFNEGAFVKHIDRDTSQIFNLDRFLRICPKFKDGEYREEILHIEYTMSEITYGLEYVEVYFKFFLNGEYSHCGVDQFVFSMNGYTLPYIDAIYSTGSECWEESKRKSSDNIDFSSLDVLMDNWHYDVAHFHFDEYFGFMDESFIFLGTDPNERWGKKEFAGFSKPYFEKESTWDFNPLWRNWYISEDGNTAWFEEQLETWMEECRGSGVLKKINGEWKIVHYNLTVLIENEKIKKFIKLRQK